jgi:dihydrolipoamide dehydrogenase
MREFTADICIIGGGPAGYVAAVRASQLGAKVALIEKDELGGTCLNRGCIPTKALLKTAEAFAMTAKFREFGIELPEGAAQANPGIFMARKDAVVKNLRAGLAHLMASNGIEVLKGRGVVESPRRVMVTESDGETAVNCGKIIITTGSEPLKPPIPGVGSDGVITSDEALSAGELPKSVVIIGAGAIGLEFATFYRSLGCAVTVAEMKERALPEEDPELSAALLRVMKKSGIKFRLGVRVKEIVKTPDGLETVIEEAGKSVSVASEKVLLAAGRKLGGVTPDILALGVGVSHGAIEVNGRMMTCVDGIYAAGDAVGGRLLAHLAFAEGKAAAENACGLQTEVDYTAVPACVYTSPEAASVGLSEEGAKAKGLETAVGRFELRANGRALCHGERDGFVKVVTDRGTGVILGGCILGHDASEMISVLTLAVRLGLTAEVLADMIFPHPTISEAIGEACADALGRAIHK